MKANKQQFHEDEIRENETITYTFETDALDHKKIDKYQLFECGGCKAIISKPSVCSVCGAFHGMKNEPIPLENGVQVMMSDNKVNEKTPITVFCIDCSGSMVGGRINSIHNIITKEIEETRKAAPRNRICLIGFHSDMQIIGDGTKDVVRVPAKATYDELLKIAQQNSQINPVQQCYEDLRKAVPKLSLGGFTCSLSPLAMAIKIASNYGGQVIFCTDGLLNRGIKPNKDIISDLSQLAQRNNVVVHIFGFEDCRMFTKDFNAIASNTGGQIETVTEIDVEEKMGIALKKQRLGREAKAKLIIPPFMKCLGESEKIMDELTMGAELKFECQIKSKQQLEGRNTIVTQIQFTYTDMKGNTMLYLQDKVIPLTRNVQRDVVPSIIRQTLDKLLTFINGSLYPQAIGVIEQHKSNTYDVSNENMVILNELFSLIEKELRNALKTPGYNMNKIKSIISNALSTKDMIQME